MDLFTKCENYSVAKDAQASGLYPYFIPLEESEGPLAKFNGKTLIMCGSNNYLGLTTHPEVQEAVHAAVSRFDAGQSGNHQLVGRQKRLCDFRQRGSCQHSRWRQA